MEHAGAASDPVAMHPPVRAVGSGLGRDSATRLAADGATMVVGMLAGVVIARALGPEGKGVYSSLSYLVDVAALIAAMGLSETAVVWIGRRVAPVQAVVSAVVAMEIVVGLIVGGVFVMAAIVLAGTPEILRAAAAGSVSVVAVAMMTVLSGPLIAQRQLAKASVASLVVPGVTAVMIPVLVVVADGGVFGAMLAGTVGSLVGLAVFGRLVVSLGVSLRPRIREVSVVDSMRFGAAVQAAALLQALAARADVLVVLWLRGGADAGQYSIALTFAVVVVAVPRAIAYAAFPRLSNETVDGRHELLVQTTRLAFLGAVCAALALAVVVPFVVPALFGAEFGAAVGPTQVALFAGMLAGVQWSIARGRVTQGHPGAMTLSFGISTVVMLAGDLLLVPLFGITGAAVAAGLGAAAGCVVCLAPRTGTRRIGLREILPRARDLPAVIAALRRSRGAS